MLRRLFKGDHPDVATLLSNTALCLTDLHRHAEALPKYEEALAMYQRLFKGDYPDAPILFLDLGDCLYSLGRREEALGNYRAEQELLRRHGQCSQVAVTRVVPGERGEQLGLRARDVILEYAGETVFTENQFTNLCDRTKGQHIELKVRRGGTEVMAFDAREGSLGCTVDNQTVPLAPASKP